MKTLSRIERRTATSLVCVHCKNTFLIEQMSVLSVGLPSDCCKRCWQEFLDEQPNIAKQNKLKGEPVLGNR